MNHLPQTQPGVPAPSVDPLPNELEAITSLGQIFQWLGATDAVQHGLVEALGGTPKLRDLVYIKASEWDAAVSQVRINVPPQGDA